MAVTSLCSVDDLLRATGADPFVRGTLRRGMVAAWEGDGAVAWAATDPEEQVSYLQVLGAPEAAATLVRGVVATLGTAGTRITVPRGTGEHLDGWTGVDWDFRWTDRLPEEPPEPAVRVEEDAVAALLAVASPTASAQPGDPHVRAWWGVPGQQGLVACAADTSATPGVGHISSVAVHPEVRGRGLGGVVTATLTRDLLQSGCDVVTLGHFTGNAPATALYERLGFRLTHEFTSGPLS